MRSVSCPFLMALVLLSAACTDSLPSADTHQDRHQTDDREAREIARVMERYPPRIEGPFGVSDTSAYLEIDRPKLSHFPYRMSGDRVLASMPDYFGPPHPKELPALSRAVVRATVVAIGLPHFNSSDGSFWDGELVGGAAEDGVWGISRQVLVRVDEVLGSLLPEVREGSYLTLRLPGGQIAVTLTDQAARQLGYEDGVVIFAEQPPVDMAVGEEAVIFLDLRRRTGLFGGVLAYRYELGPSSFSGFKLWIEGDRLVHPEEPKWEIGLRRMRSLVAAELGARTEPDVELGRSRPVEAHHVR